MCDSASLMHNRLEVNPTTRDDVLVLLLPGDWHVLFESMWSGKVWRLLSETRPALQVSGVVHEAIPHVYRCMKSENRLHYSV